MNELLLRRRVAASKSLPYDAEIEYLESDGASYINTGISNGSSFHFDFDASVSTLGNVFMIGRSTKNGTHSTCIVVVNISGYKFRWSFANSSYTISDLPVVVNIRHNFNNIASWRNLVIDDTYQTNVTGGSVTYLGNVYLFCRSAGGTASGFAKMKLYYCKLYNGTALVRDYIPVRVGTTGYLYDKVSGQLFGNAGTGSFILGPDK